MRQLAVALLAIPAYSGTPAMPAPLPPYLVTPLPPCSIVFDRHVHKNGGTTLRKILQENDLRDGWVYWGYGAHQFLKINELVMKTMLDGPRPANGSSCADWPARRQPLRMSVEYHYARNPQHLLLSSFGPHSPLQAVSAQCGCRIVLVTRLREPLAYYASFYTWTIEWRQKRNASRFGASMLEWAPRNLQSTIFMSPLDATWAEFVGVHSAEATGPPYRRDVFSQFDEPGPQPASRLSRPASEGAARRALLRRQLAAYDLVGLLERFDETMLLLADLTGLQRLLYTRSAPKPTNVAFKTSGFDTLCPDRAHCEAAIRRVAPVDYAIYDEASEAFRTRVDRMGAPFQARLAAYRAANQRYQAAARAAAGRAKAREVEVAAATEAAEAAGAGERAAPAPILGQERPRWPADYDGKRVYERASQVSKKFHHEIPMFAEPRRLDCALGSGHDAREACQRAYADTP